MKKSQLLGRGALPRPRRKRDLPNDPHKRAQAIADATGQPVEVVTLILLAGRCRVCGCTETTPCELEDGQRCSWVDAAHSLCSSPKCVAVIPLAELEREVLA